ncbi:hypothetical protein [Nocardioides bizhenqiangii]|uniref:Amidase domain-containing protein n=1 Tax=Nocardioides bizhenqiangii TaxID=3095076 RepID=A0ABZ0ZL97_9ACTN|nr:MULTISPECIES: hypothetical protein [unclassified Nocardioides]MDZ5620758.1 hypothetical protein [Nocardioides sp. HM23]WQQ25123.1 hypothetical protein SHK19_14250 [Nocardioides sp. HM61]
MFEIELDMFSGLPNPRWELEGKEADAFIARIVANRRQVRSLRSIGPVLGYRGYIVRAYGETARRLAASGIPPVFRISSLPEELAPSEQDALSGFEGQTLASEPEDGEETIDEFDGLPRPVPGTCSLAYTRWNDFSFWNGSRQENNNCYCYAANYAANHFGMPGRKAGQGLLLGSRTINYRDKPTAGEFTEAMRADGWRTGCTGKSLRITAVMAKITRHSDGHLFWDFHFYRKNLVTSTNAVRWCHKAGETPATNKDASGNYITSVQNADRTFSDPFFHYDYWQVVDTYFTAPEVTSLRID